MYLFSKSTLAFYPDELRDIYILAGSLPDDVIEVDDDIRDKFQQQSPAGKKLGVNGKGLPAWVLLSKEELIVNIEEDRNARIIGANDFINSQQWPSMLSLGMLSDNEKSSFMCWLEYIKSLSDMDVSEIDNIEWPEVPTKNSKK